MELSLTRRFCFIHVPRTGGNSVARALRPFADVGPWSIHDGDNALKHSTARELRDRLPEWDSLFSFAVVRHPCDWLHSRWRFQPQMADHWRGQRHPDAHVRRWLAGCERRKDWPLARYVDSQCRWAAKTGGMYRHWCCDGEQIVGAVVRYEELADEWPLLCDSCGIPTDTPLPRTNTTTLPDGSPRGDWREDFTPALIGHVREAFAVDFAWGGWS